MLSPRSPIPRYPRAVNISSGIEMAPTRSFRSATPPSIIDAGKIFTGLQLVIPLSILMFGFIYAFSKAGDIYNQEKLRGQGIDPKYYSSGPFSIISDISGGLIGGSCSVFAIEPINGFGRAVFPIFSSERGCAINKSSSFDRSLLAPSEGPEDKWRKQIEEQRKAQDNMGATL